MFNDLLDSQVLSYAVCSYTLSLIWSLLDLLFNKKSDRFGTPFNNAAKLTEA